MKIPQIIWAIWLDFGKNDDGKITDDLSLFINRINKTHSDGWEINIITKWSDLIKFIKTDYFIMSVLDNKFILPAHKSDLIRYFLLSKYGGFWVDLSTYLLSSINNMIDTILTTNTNDKTIDVSFICYYMPILDALEWQIKSLNNIYEIIPYKDRIKWQKIQNTIIKLKKDYSEVLTVMPENYFIGASKGHYIINNVYERLQLFWKNNLANIKDNHIMCQTISKYHLELMKKICDFNIDDFIGFAEKQIILNFNTISKEDIFINTEIASCGYLFNYLQLFIAIHEYGSNKKIIYMNTKVHKKIQTDYTDSMCFNNNCNNLILKVEDEYILLLSASYNRLGKWSNKLEERLSWNNTYLGNKLKLIKDMNTQDAIFNDLINNGFYQLKFSSYTRSSPIVQLLKKIDRMSNKNKEIVGGNIHNIYLENKKEYNILKVII